MSEEFVICFNCGKRVPAQMKDAKPTWYGSYRNADLIQAVCVECYANGIRTDIGKTIEKQRASK